MIRLPLFAVALALAASAPAQARDPRIVTRHYTADEVTRIDGRVSVQASIAFSDDEHIENVAIGDSNSWQVTPNKRANMLFVKPLSVKARTNMTVITDRHTYLFDLVAGGAAQPLYVLRFTYPDEPKPKPAPALADAGLTAAEAGAIPGAGVKPPVDPASLNFDWRQRGKPGLLPAKVYDDGTSTYLQWPANVPIPAIQIRNEAGVEGPVNFAVRDDMTVIEGVPRIIVLRFGKDVATLEYAAQPGKPRTAALAASQNPSEGR
ncbi:type IV secretion system protein VirB9 [Novosphingobium kunmingense]|uniref:Type IV secretion system protein VirB9 n=1 Tax=Novosphingobium kunmingense TaxID=1211806 RepID=A0A2N0HJE8_9SPHN|nr:TrbG/VirB9 family P-type conjugative transfer protein [Novosphingobium kunmingense]PKB19063.1 type IV secretion system protein VirB9 [Novosphingobium kunmingense]